MYFFLPYCEEFFSADYAALYELVIGAPGIRPDGKRGLAPTMRMRVRPLCALTLLLLLLPLLFHARCCCCCCCVVANQVSTTAGDHVGI